MAEPDAKRAKVDDIFTTFHNNEICMKRLLDARRWFLIEKDGFCLLKILNCNGYKSVSFSDAFCEVSRNVYDCDKRRTFAFPSIFKEGFSTLDAFIASPVNVPNRRGERMALERLLGFLMYGVNGCQSALSLNIQTNNNRVTETDWALRLSHHLLSMLAANPNYTLDDRKFHMSDMINKVCPCCQEKLFGKFGDTSIGCTEIWHGCLDIILGKNSSAVPVTVAFESDSKSPLGYEVEMGDGETIKSFYEQMISETIVNSHLQKKLNPDNENFLFPTIHITEEEVLIFLYDCENDMLLESSPLRLLNYDGLAMHTVLALWLVINYKYFCSGTPESMKELNYTADFPGHIASVRKVYNEDVDYQCGTSTAKRQRFNPFNYNDMTFVFGSDS